MAALNAGVIATAVTTLGENVEQLFESLGGKMVAPE